MQLVGTALVAYNERVPCDFSTSGFTGVCHRKLKKTEQETLGSPDYTTVTDSTMVPLRNFLGPKGMLRQVLCQQEGKTHAFAACMAKNSQKLTSRPLYNVQERIAFTKRRAYHLAKRVVAVGLGDRLKLWCSAS